jgi:hypothetical protein
VVASKIPKKCMRMRTEIAVTRIRGEAMANADRNRANAASTPNSRRKESQWAGVPGIAIRAAAVPSSQVCTRSGRKEIANPARMEPNKTKRSRILLMIDGAESVTLTTSPKAAAAAINPTPVSATRRVVSQAIGGTTSTAVASRSMTVLSSPNELHNHHNRFAEGRAGKEANPWAEDRPRTDLMLSTGRLLASGFPHKPDSFILF